jgi:hypothetical protein
MRVLILRTFHLTKITETKPKSQVVLKTISTLRFQIILFSCLKEISYLSFQRLNSLKRVITLLLWTSFANYIGGNWFTNDCKLTKDIATVHQSLARTTNRPCSALEVSLIKVIQLHLVENTASRPTPGKPYLT